MFEEMPSAKELLKNKVETGITKQERKPRKGLILGSSLTD
jgi:hypothetical protein